MVVLETTTYDIYAFNNFFLYLYINEYDDDQSCVPIYKLFLTITLLGVAGMCSKTTVAPLDRIKILLQAHSTHYKHLGVFSGLRHIVRKESFFALYKGNGAQMVRIFPYAAIQFTSFEFYKRVMQT